MGEGHVVADLIITLIIAAYVIWQGATLLPRTVRLLMGAVPDEVEFDQMVENLRALGGVQDIHHVHVWNLGEHHRALEAHLTLVDYSQTAFEGVKRRARAMLEKDFGIAHATFEPCLATDCDDALIPAHPAPNNGKDTAGD